MTLVSTALPAHDASRTRGASLQVASGNAIRIIDAALRGIRAGERAALAIVLETEGSTYAGTGAMAVFGEDGHVGWLSGGCLEPEIERCASAAASSGAIGWLEIDTRADESLLSGSAVGCRGRLRMALLPLHELAGIEPVLERWLLGHAHAMLEVSADGVVRMEASTLHREWSLHAQPVAWPAQRWSVSIPRPPDVLILGAGPESATLVPLLRELGWRVRVAERRPRWRDDAALARLRNAAMLLDATPRDALVQAGDVDAVLVMHHHFELDREALDALAASTIPFIGLLGPVRRQEDLFKLLRPEQRAALQPRLRSPVGIDLGGRGPETIALSIAAQMQAWRHDAGA
jgi:xanthine dehydrogenase accessory factor